MRFQVFDKGTYPQHGNDLFYFCRDNWDDYNYKTSFDTYYYDSAGDFHEIGPIKIGYKNMQQGTRVFDHISNEFDSLPDDYFSLGQSEEYYERISELGDNLRRSILECLHDIAFDLTLYNRVKNEDVVKKSLLRGISEFSLKYQLNRMANGGARLTKYEFTYSSPKPHTKGDFTSIQLNFRVIPGSNPPTNIHVLIGRNGTGKTRLLQNMIRSIRLNDPSCGCFEYDKGTHRYGSIEEQFANVLCVAFSPFDDFSCTQKGESSIPYTYIGLEKKNSELDLFSTIENQFLKSFVSCMTNAQKKKRWVKTTDILKSDPTFSESQLDAIADEFEDWANINSEIEGRVKSAFSQLSSGHKVTLLIITSCVDKLEEKSIVLMDEPENHLHPPLLSAFIRAFSYLLMDRNGVAIISTHSPVVLQEVPSTCVWALRRTGCNLDAERLSIETFGSNIGLLTSQVFGLEVTESGFHKLLREAAKEYTDYDTIIEKFDGKLGDEAKGILRTMLAIKRNNEIRGDQE
jgi:predicted ATPase